MKLSSVKELIIQLMYAVYMQNYNVTVLFKEKNFIYTKEQTLYSREIWEVQKHSYISVFLLDNINKLYHLSVVIVLLCDCGS